jgi:hypothetical protein
MKMTAAKPSLGGVDRYVVPPGLGSLAGPLGALALEADVL